MHASGELPERANRLRARAVAVSSSTTATRRPPVSSLTRLNSTANRTVKPVPANTMHDAGGQRGHQHASPVDREARIGQRGRQEILQVVERAGRACDLPQDHAGDGENEPQAQVEHARNLQHRPRLDTTDDSLDLARPQTRIAPPCPPRERLSRRLRDRSNPPPSCRAARRSAAPRRQPARAAWALGGARSTSLEVYETNVTSRVQRLSGSDMSSSARDTASMAPTSTVTSTCWPTRMKRTNRPPFRSAIRIAASSPSCTPASAAASAAVRARAPITDGAAHAGQNEQGHDQQQQHERHRRNGLSTISPAPHHGFTPETSGLLRGKDA